MARSCAAIADELVAARELLKAYESQIAALEDRLTIAKQQITLAQEVATLQRDRAASLEAVITAERQAKEALDQLRVEQQMRIAKLEKKLRRARQFGVAAGVVAALLIVVRVGK